MPTEFSEPAKDRAQHTDIPDSKYPYNQVIQFPNGIRIVIGHERDKEKLEVYHPSGTNVRWMPDGKMSVHVNDHLNMYNKGGLTLTVDENGDIHMNGHSKLTVAGGAHIEVQGDLGAVVGGQIALAALKDSALSVKGNLYLGVDGDLNMNVKGNMSQQVGGNLDIGTGGTTTHQSTEISLNPADGQSGYKGSSGAIVA